MFVVASLCGGALAEGGRSYVDAGLLIGERAEGGDRAAGLRLTVEDGWKTYWRSPGEAGVPPRFDWSGSTNLAEARIAWPTPQVFESFGYLTIGYSGETVLPLLLIPEDPAKPIGLDLVAEIGVCREICVFETIGIAMTIAPGDPGADASAVSTAEGRITPLAADAGVTEVTCRISGSGEDRAFSARIDFGRPPGEAHVALEGPEGSWFQNAESTSDATGISVDGTLSLTDEAAWIDRSAIRMTVLGPAVAADIRGCSAGQGAG